MVGIPFEERWARLDEAAVLLRQQLPAVPLWLASWGSPAGLRRVARHGDGWLASAYNTDPETFAAARAQLPAGMPAAVVTMWTYVTEDDAEADRQLEQVLAPMIGRDPDRLRETVCVGSAGRCRELVARYAEAGCDRMHFWPLGDEERQVELIADFTVRARPVLNDAVTEASVSIISRLAAVGNASRGRTASTWRRRAPARSLRTRVPGTGPAATASPGTTATPSPAAANACTPR